MAAREGVTAIDGVDLSPDVLEAARRRAAHDRLVEADVSAPSPLHHGRRVPTHFESASGEPTAITTHVHLISDHISAAHEAGWTLAEMHERVVDERWLDLKPGWPALPPHPVSAAFVFRPTSTSPG